MKKGSLKAIGAFVMLMVMGNTIAEEQNPPITSGTTIVADQQVSLPILIPGNGPIGTTNWGGGGVVQGPAQPCAGC